ncbi:MAG: hypothetical protein H6925_05300 [Holosporaceae bacterium]|nr:MAG: hypothetical protein H6925_05300 [Holosporaceae bacterium]
MRDLGLQLQESETRHQQADADLQQVRAEVANLEAALEGDQRRILELEGKLQGANASYLSCLGH